MAIYTDKLTDSFVIKLQIFLFTKAFDGEILEYIKNKEQVIKEFKNFELTLDIAHVYSSQYYQFEETEDIKLGDVSIKLKKLVSNLMDNKKYIISKSNIKSYLGDLFYELKETYKFMSKEDFKELIENKSCSYCGITVEQIAKLGSQGKLHNKRSETRGYTLEIDRIEPNLEYSTENCCMSCYWCNNAKTDEFSASEFKEIARGINGVWKSRGAKIINFDSIEFWKK